MRRWHAARNVETLCIEPGSPWENGYVESFNGQLRDELLDREIFYTLTEAKILLERWPREYNARCGRTVRWAIDRRRIYSRKPLHRLVESAWQGRTKRGVWTALIPVGSAAFSR